MPRDYKNIKKKKPAPLTERFSNALSFITGLSLGIFIAVIVYFHEHNATIKVTNPLLDPAQAVAPDNVDDSSEEIAQLPEPKFDFYQILPNKEVSISEWESTEEDDVVKNNTEDQPVMFVLQVGSFKQFGAADEIKAKLALMGVTADIQRVVINGQDVRHRVRIGPYKNTNKLQQAKDRLLANDLDFMLLKLKMEDI